MYDRKRLHDYAIQESRLMIEVQKGQIQECQAMEEFGLKLHFFLFLPTPDAALCAIRQKVF